jgi:hypothetical protein
MNKNESYEDIADRSWDDIPDEKLLPDGSWLLRGRNASYQPAKNDGNPSILFDYAAKEPMNDVDDGELAALGEDYDTSQNRIFHRIWLETGRDFKVARAFLELHGIEVDPTKSVKATLPAFKGTEIVAVLTTQTFTDNAGMTRENNVPTKFVAVDELES